jgi:hypothetical protein
MELVWLDRYEEITPLGYELISIRESFLSAPRVRNAYLGYATQQFKKLESRGDNTFGPDLAKRTAKHARHMYRLLQQGLELWQTGRLTIRLTDPESVRKFGDLVADGDIDHAREMLAQYEHHFNTTRPVLPEAPDEREAEQWLQRVRRHFYQPST